MSLRVAILAPISWRVPPRHYGPWEQFASLLTEGLVERGVDVTLFATADSVTTRAPRRYRADRLLGGSGARREGLGGLHISAVFERAGEFDVIHNSFDFLPLTYSGLVDTPVVTTIHGFSSEQIVPVYEKYNERGYYVAISDADRHRAARLRRHDPPRHRPRRVRRSGASRATTCSSSGGSIRTRGRPRRSRSRARRACR